MAPPFDNAFTEHHQPPNWINSNKTKRNGMEIKKQDNFTQFHLSSHWYISHSYGL